MYAQHSTGTLKGTVINNEAQPVSDVHVLWNGDLYSTATGEQGQFTIKNIEPGSYRLSVNRIGYEPLYRTIKIKTGATRTVTLRLSGTSYSSGSVVVTATRTKRDLEEVTVPVTVVPQKEIQSNGSMRLSDVLAEQTGLVLNSDHGTGIQVQGFASEYILIMLNGQPLIGRTAGTLDLSRICVGNVEQVEMTKGPSSALWGSDELADVINIITEEGSQPFQADITTRYGTAGPRFQHLLPKRGLEQYAVPEPQQLAGLQA